MTEFFSSGRRSRVRRDNDVSEADGQGKESPTGGRENALKDLVRLLWPWARGRKSTTKAALSLLVGLVVSLAIFVLIGGGEGRGPDSPLVHISNGKSFHPEASHGRQIASSLVYGDTLPDFCLPTLAGSTVTDAYLQGHIGVIAFLPFDSASIYDAPTRLLDVLYPFLNDLRILVVLIGDSTHLAGLPADTTSIQSVLPVAFGLRSSLSRIFRLPWFSCAYILLVDRAGVVRLGTPAVSEADLRTIVARYR